MVLLFYSEGMGVERDPFSAFSTLPENISKGTKKTSGIIHTSHGFVIFVIAQATGSSPPVKGMATLLKGGMQGR
jgi:hypothetical protein